MATTELAATWLAVYHLCLLVERSLPVGLRRAGCADGPARPSAFPQVRALRGGASPVSTALGPRYRLVGMGAPQPSPTLAGGLSALACLVLAGCGEAGGATRASAAPKALALQTAPAIQTTSTETVAPEPSRADRVVARIDASSDRVLAEGKLHIAAGALSDKVVRHELELMRKHGVPVPSGNSVQSFENPRSGTEPGVYVETPEALWNPQAKPIADWIVPVLAWASAHGWHGTVTSGYRTFYEQAQLNAAGAYSAPAGLSNHETTVYPGGAVDVTEPSQLIVVLRGYSGPQQLVGGVLGAIDPEHFSATGY
jgi:hypothetical protein